MGNPVSKPEESTVKNKITSDSTSTVATPVRHLELDPRSPSCNIARTPIEQILNRDVLDGSTSTDHHIKNKCSKIIDTDPRSPTTEFIRTPIVVEANPNYEIKLRNKALDNVKKQLAHSEPNRSTTDNAKICNSSINLKANLEINEIDNIELKKTKSETSVQSNINDEIDCKSIPGLLETNLDDVLCPLEVTDLTCSPVKVKHRKSVEINNMLDKEIQTNDNEEEDISVLSSQPNSIKAIKRNSILRKPVDEENENKNETNSNNSPERPFESKHKTLVETPKSNNIVHKMPDLSSKEIKTPRKLLNLVSPSVVEFNKKLTNLIYEDTLQDDLNLIKIKESSRTPLSIRNCNEFSTKPRLKVSDKPTKLHTGSKIPVLREKKLKERQFSSLQCENTPPKSMEVVAKTKVTNWDADNTLII